MENNYIETDDQTTMSYFIATTLFNTSDATKSLSDDDSYEIHEKIRNYFFSNLNEPEYFDLWCNVSNSILRNKKIHDILKTWVTRLEANLDINEIKEFINKECLNDDMYTTIKVKTEMLYFFAQGLLLWKTKKNDWKDKDEYLDYIKREFCNDIERDRLIEFDEMLQNNEQLMEISLLTLQKYGIKPTIKKEDVEMNPEYDDPELINFKEKNKESHNDKHYIFH